MKKLTVMLLMVAMVCSMSACKKEPSSVTPTTPTGLIEVPTISQEEFEQQKYADEKIKFIFENDKLTMKMTKIGLDTVSYNIYRFIEGTETPDEQVVLTQLQVTFYDGNPKPVIEPEHNPEDILVEIPEEPIVVTFADLNYDLFSDDDLEITMQCTPNADYLIHAFPGELLAELRNRDYGQYCVNVKARFHRINGEDVRICGFDFKGEATFEEKFDVSTVNKTPATLTDTGATLTLQTEDILTACGIDAAKVNEINFEFFLLHSSKQDLYLMDTNGSKLSLQNNAQNAITIDMKYDNPVEQNNLFSQQLKEAHGYFCTSVKWEDDAGRHYEQLYFLLDVSEAYTTPSTEPTNSTEAVA